MEQKNATNPAPVIVISPGNLVGGANGWLGVLGWDSYADAVNNHYKPDFMVIPGQ